MALLFSSLLLASAATVSAQSSTRTTSAFSSFPTSSTGEPCNDIAQGVLDGERYFAAKTAYDCLKSVPLDKDGDSKLIDELKLLWQWESDSGWIKKAPQSWELGSLDIEKELDNIKANLDNYESEYDLQLAIQNITIRSGNFHFNYRPDITRMFRFWRPIGVASISSDGKSIPKLYTDLDALALSAGGGGSNGSEIEQINGQDPYAYLQSLASQEQYLDPDARLANIFSPGDTESYGAFEVQPFYHGATTQIKYKNGTEATYENYAIIGQSSAGAVAEFNSTSYWMDVTDGPSFFKTFCTGDFTGDLYTGLLGSKNASSFEPPLARILDDRPIHTGKVPSPSRNRRRQVIPDTYPSPVAIDDSEVVAGYFLKKQGYEDVAVLKIVSFMPEEDTTGQDFQDTVQSFLRQSKRDNKNKLVIDLRENGGGMIQLYLDTFMQLFPKDLPFSGQYYRAQEQFTAIGDAIAKYIDENKLSDSLKENIAAGYYFWAWWKYVDGKGQNFPSWDSFNGPVELNGDKFTTLMQWNTTNSRDNVLLSPGFSFFNDTTQDPPFDPKNIVLLTDGLCGSACAAFAENMKNIAGVKTVVVGGRPENKHMQGVAGSKGGQVTPLAQFPFDARQLFEVFESERTIDLNQTKVKDLADISQVLIRAGDEQTRVQSKEHLRKGDATGTPLGFTYEAADCKIFYTAESYADPRATWTHAWDAFNDDSKCVEGSTKHETSLSGGFKPFGTGEVKDENLPQPEGNQSGSGGKEGEGKKGAAANLKAGGAVLALSIAVAISLM